MKRISCLLLDMGGVLTEDQREDKISAMIALLGEGIARETFYAAYWRHRSDYDRGLVDGAGYWGRVAGELGIDLAGSAYQGLVRADLESWFNMRGRMLDFLGGIQGRVGRLVLLSNIHADGARYIRSGEGRAWASRFDTLVLSCDHGIVKPESGIYELALRAAGALPGDALFVDDNPVNVEAARRVGMSSFRFAGEDDFLATIERDYALALLP